jgi:hypothetical protein
MECQATFKEHCTWPRCDCDRVARCVHTPKYATVKFNSGRGALLCNKCNRIIREDFDPADIEDKQYLCKNCQPRHLDGT